MIHVSLSLKTPKALQDAFFYPQNPKSNPSSFIYVGVSSLYPSFCISISITRISIVFMLLCFNSFSDLILLFTININGEHSHNRTRWTSIRELYVHNCSLFWTFFHHSRPTQLLPLLVLSSLKVLNSPSICSIARALMRLWDAWIGRNSDGVFVLDAFDGDVIGIQVGMLSCDSRLIVNAVASMIILVTYALLVYISAVVVTPIARVHLKYS